MIEAEEDSDVYVQWLAMGMCQEVSTMLMTYHYSNWSTVGQTAGF